MEEHDKYVFKGTDGANKVELSFESSTEITDITGSYGVYPYTQTYAANSFGESTNVKSVKLTALNGVAKLAGPAAISLTSEGIPEVTMLDGTYPEVTLDCSNEGNGVALGTTKETATEFWFALPPGTIEGGIKITAIDTDNNVFVKETKKDISIPRNQIQPMATLEFKNNGTGDYQLIYTRPEEETAPYDFGGSSDYENLKYFDQFITNHYYDSKSKRFVIQFKEPLTQIKDEAFYGKDLTSIIFPDSLTTIGKSAFNYCSLERIIFPGNLIYIGTKAFNNCHDLKTLIFLPSPTNTYLEIDTDENSGGFGASKLDTLHLNRELVHLRNGIPYTPSECQKGLFCYFECNKEKIGEHYYTFEEIVLGNQVKTLHRFMFHAAKIKSITIPSSVTSMSNYTFESCWYLESVTFEESSGPLTVDYYYNTLNDSGGPFHDSQKLKTVVLNRELKLSDYYQECLNEDRKGLFSDIKSLTDIILGPNVKTIHDYMFCNLPITSLTIPNTVTSIGNYAFQGCTALPSITIPGSVTSIGHDAFHACEGLTSLTFESGTVDLRIGPTIESTLNYGPFYDSKNLTTLNLNRNLAPTYEISLDRHGLFSEIASLKNVTLGNNVKTIGNRMFLETGITKITIPGSVDKIDLYVQISIVWVNEF